MKTYRVEVTKNDLFSFLLLAGYEPLKIVSHLLQDPNSFFAAIEERFSYDRFYNPFFSMRQGYSKPDERRPIENQPLLDKVQHLVEQFFRQTKRGGGRAWLTYDGLYMQHSGRLNDRHKLIEWVWCEDADQSRGLSGFDVG